MDTCGSEKCLLTTVGNLTANFTQAVSTRPTSVLQFPSADVQGAICIGTHDMVPAAGEVVPASRPTPLNVPGRTARSPGHTSRSRQFLKH